MYIPDTCDVSFCSLLDGATLANYGQASRETRRSVVAYSRLAFQLRYSLRKFMSDQQVIPFRDVMRLTGTVISGSVALHFFERTPVGDADLDLVTEGQHAAQLISFITGLGYKYSPRHAQQKDLQVAIRYARFRYAVRDQHIYPLPDTVLDVLSFKADSSIIQVLIAANCAIDTILSFHSTPVMNAITFRAAYSLFPRNTFKRKAGIVFRTMHASEPIKKYKDAGYELSSQCTERCYRALGDEFVAYARYVGDKHTWVIDLDDRPSIYIDTFLFNSFQVRFSVRVNVWVTPSIVRQLYIGRTYWTQGRTFADAELLQPFVYELFRQQQNSRLHTDYDAISAVLRSGRDPLFRHVPPCATDIEFLPSWDAPTRPSRLPVICGPGDRLVYEPDPDPIEDVTDDAGDVEATGVTSDIDARATALPSAGAVDAVSADNEGKRKNADAGVVYDGSTSIDVAEPPVKKMRPSGDL